MSALIRRFVFFLCLGLSQVAHTQVISGKVVGVTDGDTVTVLDAANQSHKIRVAGIDAPEKKQAFGERSKQTMSDLVYGKTVHIDVEKTDRFGRTVGKVLVAGRDAGLLLVENGLAWHFKKYEREQSSEDWQRYADAETRARGRKLGLWVDADPVAPWEWRKTKSEK